jgi:peptidoglycan hydrolase-like protein with peptidoglycan-binding domain
VRRVVAGILLIGAVAVVGGATVAGGTGVVPDLVTAASGAKASAPPAAASDVKTAAVERRTLQTEQDLAGTLGFEGDRAVVAGGGGTVTWLPSAGSVIARGAVLYELDGRRRPRLFYGDRPMWRTLDLDVSNGADVQQLEQNLKALGYAPKGMKVDRHWDSKTTTAVKAWQKDTGQERDGSVEAGDIAFLPGAIRVATTQAALGSSVGPGAGVLSATTSTPVVTIALDASKRDIVKEGQAVTVELPDGSTVDGTVRSIGRVATPTKDGSTSTLPVTIDLAAGAKVDGLDQAPVTIHVVDERHADVLAVPVNALVALLEGGYAVEVANPDGTRHYMKVKLGLFQDGMVEVSGQGLAAGTSVVVAR